MFGCSFQLFERADGFIISQNVLSLWTDWSVLCIYSLVHSPWSCFLSCSRHKSTHQSPWETNRSSASHEIPRILWNPTVHYRIHKCPPPVPILSTPHPTTWRSILILSSHRRLGLPNGLLTSGFPTKILYIPLLSLIVLHAPPISFLLIFITRTMFGVQYRSVSSSLCIFLNFHVTSSLSAPNIHLSTPFWNPHSVRPFLNVSDQVSHPYRTAQLQFCISQSLNFWISNRKMKVTAPNESNEPLTKKALYLYIYSKFFQIRSAVPETVNQAYVTNVLSPPGPHNTVTRSAASVSIVCVVLSLWFGWFCTEGSSSGVPGGQEKVARFAPLSEKRGSWLDRVWQFDRPLL